MEKSYSIGLIKLSSFIKSDDSVIYLSMPEEKLNLFNGKHRQELQEKLSDYLQEDCNIFLEEGEHNEHSHQSQIIYTHLRNSF